MKYEHKIVLIENFDCASTKETMAEMVLLLNHGWEIASATPIKHAVIYILRHVLV